MHNLATSERKSVLMVVRWPVGGIRTYLKYIFDGWLGPDLQITFLMPSVAEVSALQKEGFWESVNWILHPMENPGFLDWMKFVRSEIGRGRWNLIHCQGFTSALSTSLFLPSGCSSIFTSHDVLLANQFPGFRGRVKRKIMGVLLSRFDIVQAVSEDGMQNMLEFLPGIARKEKSVILNGVDTQRFKHAKAKNLRQSLELEEGAILIGFFGRFMAQKGFRYLVDAIELLVGKGYDICCLCFGAGAFIREEQSAIQSRGLSPYFRFMGFEPDISSSIKGVNLVVMPSLWEACPLQPMEVLSAGVPFVGTSCIGLREVCKDTPAEICTPADSSALVIAIENILNDETKKFESFSEQAVVRYGKRRMQEQYEDLYQRILVDV